MGFKTEDSFREKELLSFQIPEVSEPIPYISCCNKGFPSGIVNSSSLSPFTGEPIILYKETRVYPGFPENHFLEEEVKALVSPQIVKEVKKGLRTFTFEEIPEVSIKYTTRNCKPLNETVYIKHPDYNKELAKHYTLNDSYKKEATMMGFNHVALKHFLNESSTHSEPVRSQGRFLPGDLCIVNEIGSYKYPNWVGKTVKVISCSLPSGSSGSAFYVEDVSRPEKHRKIHPSHLDLLPGQIYDPSTKKAWKDSPKEGLSLDD